MCRAHKNTKIKIVRTVKIQFVKIFREISDPHRANAGKNLPCSKFLPHHFYLYIPYTPMHTLFLYKTTLTYITFNTHRVGSCLLTQQIINLMVYS